MLFTNYLLPALTLGALADAQGIHFKQVLKKKPGLAKATNTKSAPTHTKVIAASITSKLNAIKPKATKKPKAGTSGSSPKVQAADLACSPLSVKYNYVPSPNDPTGFLIDSNLASSAKAGALYPAGYANVFANQYGSLYADNYLSAIDLSTYNPSACAAYCDATSGCAAFNIYYERTPTVFPADTCSNPIAYTGIRCAIWGSAITADQAKNVGQWRSSFMVVIQGSNGYNKLSAAPAVSSFTSTPLAGAVDTSALTSNQPFIASQFFTGTNAAQSCADLCTSTNTANKNAAVLAGKSTYTPCNFFNTVDLNLNGVSQGSYCQLYSRDVSASAGLYNATINGARLDLQKSYGYTLTVPDYGTTAVATCTNLGGSSFTDVGGVKYQLKCGYDLAGAGDIGNAQVSSITACLAMCDVIAGCSGVVISNNAWCYMKNLTGVTNTPSQSSSNDLAYLPSKFTDRSLVTTPSAAASSATAVSTTARTTTTSASPTPSSSACAAMGATYTDASGISYTLKCGYDITSGVLNSVQANNFSDCFAACSSTSGCSGFTFSRSTSYCYLKNLTGVTTNPGSASGVDFAYITSKYSDQSNVAAVTAVVVSFVTVTSAWTGTATSTSTIIRGPSGTILVLTPGAATSTASAVYTTVTVNSGTALTVSTTTLAPATAGGPSRVQIAYPTAVQTCSNYGVRYAAYGNVWAGPSDTSATYATYDPASFKSLTPMYSGVTGYIAEWNPSGNNYMKVYDQSAWTNNLTLAHTFYVFANQDGYYSFNMPQGDNIVLLWVGAKAITGWTRANSDLQQYYTANPTKVQATMTFYAKMGQYLPIRLHWGNRQGQGELDFNVYGPDGSTIMSSNVGLGTGQAGPNVVQYPCDSSLGPQYPAWSQET